MRIVFTDSATAINTIAAHQHFPKRKTDLLGGAYFENNEVRINFINSKDQAMYHYFYVNEPANYAPQLIWGTRFQ
jgi:hypothetical protein